MYMSAFKWYSCNLPRFLPLHHIQQKCRLPVGIPSDVDVSNFFSVATCNPWRAWAKPMLVDVYFGTISITFIIYIYILYIYVCIHTNYIYTTYILGIIRIHELRIAVVIHGDTRRACHETGMSQWCPCAMAMFVGLWSST